MLAKGWWCYAAAMLTTGLMKLMAAFTFMTSHKHWDHSKPLFMCDLLSTVTFIMWTFLLILVKRVDWLSEDERWRRGIGLQCWWWQTVFTWRCVTCGSFFILVQLQCYLWTYSTWIFFLSCCMHVITLFRITKLILVIRYSKCICTRSFFMCFYLFSFGLNKHEKCHSSASNRARQVNYEAYN